MSEKKRFVPDRSRINDLGFKEYGLKEAFESGEDWDRWEAENIHLDVKNGLLILCFYNDYPIDLKKIKTHQDILRWTHHLLGKKWVSEYEDGPYVVRRIIEKLCALADLKLY